MATWRSGADPGVAASAERVVEALHRGQRAFAFYDAGHPAAQELRRDVEEALAQLASAGVGELIIAASGDRLFLTGAVEEGVAHIAAREVSEALVSRSVVGLKLRAPGNPKDLEALLSCLAEAPSRLHAAGGMAKVMADRDALSISVIEFDFDALLGGQPVDHTGLDPLVGRALSAALVLKGAAPGMGTAIPIAVAQVSSPSSLGNLLDELIDGAAPGVAATPPARPPAPSSLTGLNAAQLADACARGYRQVAAGATTAEALTEAAKVLSAALVRLSPSARLALLQRIADQEDSETSGALGREVPDPILLSAISQAVMGGARDNRLATAVGSLLERLRPVERDRQRLVAELGDAAAARGRPLDALFMQELGLASGASSLGSLDLPFRETRAQLIQAARLRQASERQPEIVSRTFATLRPESVGERTVRLFCAVLKGNQELDGDLLGEIRTMFRTPAQDPTLATSGGQLIRSLWARALHDGPASPAATQLLDVGISETGQDWFIGLLRELHGAQGADSAKLFFKLFQTVIEAHGTGAFRRRVVDGLDELDPALQWELERRIGELSPGGIAVVIARAGRGSPTAAVPLVRATLRGSSLPAKQAGLRALSGFASPAALELLARAAGAEGDVAARAQLQAPEVDAEGLIALQTAAVDALGASRVPEAVAPLVAVLNRHGQAGNQRMATLVARALAINATPQAQEALASGRRSLLPAVRAACGSIS